MTAWIAALPAGLAIRALSIAPERAALAASSCSCARSLVVCPERLDQTMQNRLIRCPIWFFTQRTNYA
jgi:hypothetical protein